MKRPNILFVFADQWRYAALGANGNPEVRTPNLDRLASEGVVFDQAFSGYPLCSPYRGALLTGRYAHANGVVDNEYKLRDGEVTLAHVLGREGYRTGFIGKWHLGYGPFPAEKRYGFDYLAGYDCGYGFYKTEYHENERGPILFNCWSSEGETSLAIRFLEEHKKEQASRRSAASPFALMVAWAPPHWPYQEFPQEFNTFDPGRITVPKNVPVQMKEFAAREIALYYGSVAALDHQMGRLLDALDRLDFAEDTIVVFTSDHGDHLSSHGFGKPGDHWLPPYMRASKATPYEESIHVPFLLRWPGRAAAGSRTPILLNTVDIMPTLLTLSNIDVPGVAGAGIRVPATADLSHAVTGADGPWPDSVYLQQMGEGWPRRGRWVGFWRGVRTDRWVYARWKDGEVGPLLFDRASDPEEMKNLAGRPEHGETQSQLEARLQRWLAETGDPFDTGERDPKTGMLLLGQEFNDDRWKQQPAGERKQ